MVSDTFLKYQSVQSGFFVLLSRVFWIPYRRKSFHPFHFGQGQSHPGIAGVEISVEKFCAAPQAPLWKLARFLFFKNRIPI